MALLEAFPFSNFSLYVLKSGVGFGCALALLCVVQEDCELKLALVRSSKEAADLSEKDLEQAKSREHAAVSNTHSSSHSLSFTHLLALTFCHTPVLACPWFQMMCRKRRWSVQRLHC